MRLTQETQVIDTNSGFYKKITDEGSPVGRRKRKVARRKEKQAMRRKITILARTIIPLWLMLILVLAIWLGATLGVIFGAVLPEDNPPGGGAYNPSPSSISGEIAISATNASGLLIGTPQFNILRHSPNAASEENSDVSAAEDPRGAWPPLDRLITNYRGLMWPDGVYQPTAANTAGVSQQLFKFYVGPSADDISGLVINWKGYINGSGRLQVWENDSWNTSMEASLSGADASYAISITDTTDVTVAEAFQQGYVYIQVFTDAVNQAVFTDYVIVTATYRQIDLKRWASFSGPELARRVFVIPNLYSGSASDDQTYFQTASELSRGDWWLVILPVKNAGTSDVLARFTLMVPADLEVCVASAEQMNEPNSRIRELVQTGENTWQVMVKADAEELDDNDNLYVFIHTHDDSSPGNFSIDALLEPI